VKAEQAQERRNRHFGWLLKDGNGERLGRESADCFSQYGRGFWLVSYHRAVKLDDQDAIQEVHYIGRAGLAKLPGGNEHKRDLRRMLDRYDPLTQYVICFEEPDGRSSYRMEVTPTETP
jgi:hypothetical protein